jgi:hypothetical protein
MERSVNENEKAVVAVVNETVKMVQTKAAKVKPKAKKPIKKKPQVETAATHPCAYKGCKKKLLGKRKWCAEHKKLIRKIQLRRNNITYNKRKAKKGWQPKQPHLTYKGRPTEWTREHRAPAEKLAKRRGVKLAAKLFAAK